MAEVDGEWKEKKTGDPYKREREPIRALPNEESDCTLLIITGSSLIQTYPTGETKTKIKNREEKETAHNDHTHMPYVAS